MAGLACVFTYAFFKFAWAYGFSITARSCWARSHRRARPSPSPRCCGTVSRIARMNVSAGSHFARGQRAFFFALAYLGWFVGPIILFASTTFVVSVMWHRQFARASGGSCWRSASATTRAVGREFPMSADAAAIEEAMLRLATARGAGKTICPRRSPGSRRAASGRVGPADAAGAPRCRAPRHEGRIAILRKGRPVDPDDFRVSTGWRCPRAAAGSPAPAAIGRVAARR